MSHPAWVCGLKQKQDSPCCQRLASHPAWVCGLKHLYAGEAVPLDCHTLRGCVD